MKIFKFENYVDKPIYRVVVQTSDELPAYDMGLDSIRYSADAIESAIDDLIGEFVYDVSQSAHDEFIHDPRKFGQVIGAGYSHHSGWVDIEIFDMKYVSMFDQAIDSLERGILLKEGPSTELISLDGEYYDGNRLLITDFVYDGLVWTKNPRDSGAHVCKLVNKISDDLKEKIRMKEKKEEDKNVSKEETDLEKENKRLHDELAKSIDKIKDLKNTIQTFDGGEDEIKTELKNALTKITQLESEVNDPSIHEEFEELKKLHKESVSNYKNSIKELTQEIEPLREAKRQEKADLVNNLLSVVKDSEKEQMRKYYEAKETSELKILSNAFANKLFTDTPKGVVENEDETKKIKKGYSQEDWERDYELAFGSKPRTKRLMRRG